MADTSEHTSETLESWEAARRKAKAALARRNTLLSYWCTLLESFSYSPRDFYSLVTENLAKREVPGLLVGAVKLREGTIFSRERIYLQLRRERLVFEVCAAPFGTGYFVSSRLFDRRRDARFMDYVIVLGMLILIAAGVWNEFGGMVGIIVTGLLITTIWSLMRLAVAGFAVWLDETLCIVPWIGPIFETLFHPDTYYRQDQREMYREAVHRAVMESVATMTVESGVRALSDEEMRPHFGGSARPTR